MLTAKGRLSGKSRKIHRVTVTKKTIMNKLYKLPLLILLTGVLAGGCKKSFLKLAPLSNSNAENFYKTKADFELAINAAYSTLYDIYAPEGPVSYTGEMMGDNATLYIIAGNQTDKYAFKDYNIKISNSLVYYFWQLYYKSLYNINIVLSKIEASSLDNAYKENTAAQMRFLRGLYYFHMVRLWGNVPLVTTPITVEESYRILRSTSEEEVYSLILDDLKYAEEKLLPANEVVPVGRASKGAAQAALGEVYLTLQDKANAATYLTKLYNSPLYDLQPTYADVWGPNVKNTRESVFEIQYLGGAASNGTHSPYYQGFYPNVNPLGFSGVGMNQVSEDLYNEYEAGDPRRDISVALGYPRTDGTGIELQKFWIKWADVNTDIVGKTAMANNNFAVYRYADVLLMLSEATGDPAYLNEVRDRVGLPLFGTPAYPSASYPTLDLAIEHERRVELAIEFHRWFDLKRTNRAIPVLTAKGKPVTATRLLLPIPETVRTQNNLITQNDGYTE